MRMAGFIAQLMPEGDRKLFEELFSKDRKWDLFDESGKENALSTLLHKENYVLIGSAPISFRCTCGEDRIKHSLQGLPQNEQNSLLEDDHIEIECHYCGKKYEISRETLMKWFNEKGGNVQ